MRYKWDKSEVPDILGLCFSFYSNIAWEKTLQSLGADTGQEEGSCMALMVAVRHQVIVAVWMGVTGIRSGRSGGDVKA